MPTRPAPEVDITAELVRSLLAAQHPDMAELPLGQPVEGWDNVTVPLGTDLAVRLPRRAQGVELIRHEQRWLPTLAAHCRVPVPTPVRVGAPTADYPWPWSVVPWFTGTIAAAQPVADRTAWAGELADALAGLHALDAPAEAPVNPFRGGSLRDRESALLSRLDHLRVDRDRVLAQWETAAAAPAWPHAPRWVHGDPHPANLLVRSGALVALLDFGDMTGGDPACDLATAWLTFDSVGRAAFQARTGDHGDPALWTRAAGWALVMASAMCAHSEDDPVIGPIGHHALDQLLG